MVGTWHGDVAEGNAALRARGNVRARSRAQVDTLTYGVFHLGLRFIFLSHIQTGDCSFAVKRVHEEVGELHTWEHLLCPA